MVDRSNRSNGSALAALLTDPNVLAAAEALVAVLARMTAEQLAPLLAQAKAPQPETEITKSELCAALKISHPTCDRFRKAGMPVSYVGSSPRFDLDACRSWLAGQGKAGRSTPKAPANDGVRLISRRKAGAQ